MLSHAPKALLFDLGGVLVDIDFSCALDAWAPYSALSPEDLRQRFRHDTPYERHERGEIPAAAYFGHLAQTLQLTASLEQIERGWNAIFVGEILQTRKRVEAMRGVLPCYAFTNTNASHMAAWSRLFPAVVGAFDRIFASHELGLRKPERAAFDRICDLTDTPAASILFFDDLAENVLAAEDAGLQGVLVKSPEDVAAALLALGYTLPSEAFRSS
ncbi:MAG: HAD-IA family hydrolase [Proteobacteria bacterium]|nr:HAD-IA family hydrolase [Pseudomonadota bacterium]